MKNEIKVERREDAGKGASRRLRRAGKVPAVVYGGVLDAVSIQVGHNDVWLAQENEWFYSAILNLNLDGDVQPVLLRDMQRHPAKARILHLDFQRVMADELIRVSVPLHYINQETSPAGKTTDVLIMHEMTEVEISCLPAALPERIEVDLGALEEGDVVHLSSVKLPEGVEIPALSLGPDHDVAIVVARLLKTGVDEDAAEAEAAAAESAEAAEDAPSPEDDE